MYYCRYILVLFLTLSFQLLAFPKDESETLNNDKIISSSSRVLIGSGATIFVDSKSSAALWYDKLEIMNGSKYIEDSEKNYLGTIKESENQISKIAEVAVPTDLIISKAFPNPFNPEVKITYGLPKSSNIRISIYDINGRKINELYKQGQSAGWHEYIWDGTNQYGQSIGSGTYLMTIQTSVKVKHQKITFIK